jgi:hypothetical protein
MERGTHPSNPTKVVIEKAIGQLWTRADVIDQRLFLTPLRLEMQALGITRMIRVFAARRQRTRIGF